MRRALMWVGVLAAVASVGVSAPVAGVRRVAVTVTPRSALLDGRLHVRVTGLKPGARVTLVATSRSVLGRSWRSSVSARAGRSGTIDLPRAMLISAMRPLRPVPAGDAFPALAARVSLAVRAAGKTRAATTFARDAGGSSSDVIDERPAREGFYAEYVRPHGARRGPAILFLGGSNGGLPTAFAPLLLAAHGYPVLRLAYFGLPGLPPDLERIPLEYFEGALRWLGRQPEVDPARIAVVGVSRGGELALLLGSTYPKLVHGVAAYVPSDTVVPSTTSLALPAWTLGGRAVPSEQIAVERIAGPVLAVGADDDELWASGRATRAIATRMHEHGRSDVTALVYRRAGHAVGVMVPNVPTRTILQSRYGPLRLGGSPAADASARSDSWPKLLDFLARI